MVDTAGLRLDQAPPIHLPLRLLITAPWFAVAAGVLLMVSGESALVSRWTPTALALTHLIVIGFLGQAMCGSLLQMLPVIAGAPVPRVAWVAPMVHLSLTVGAAVLAAGFLGAGPWALGLGGLLAVLGFSIFLAGAGVALARAQGSPATLTALRLSALSLVPTLVLGLALVGMLLGWVRLPGFESWVDLHLTWGLLGWVGLLILGVGLQVVPMFHVTPAYPWSIARWLAPLLFATLLGISLATLFGRVELIRPVRSIAVLGFATFAVATLWLQHRRSRPRRDATLLHWWSAMGAGLAAALAWVGGAPETLIGVLLLIGVGVGLPSGMLFKIVPFLCWFHLQQRQVSAGRFEVRVPHMGGYLSERLTRWQWGLHLAALATLSAACLDARLTALGGAFLILSSALLAGLLLAAAQRYRQTRQALDSGPQAQPSAP